MTVATHPSVSMFPWTHAAVGYALLVGLALVLRRQVSRAELVAVVAGALLPDLVDKPLAWWFGVLPSGRSLAHSLLLAVPLAVFVLAVAWYRGQLAAGAAFGLGYASHLLGDTYVALYYWRPAELTFLLWPVLPPYPYDDVTGFVNFFSNVTPTPALLVTLGLGIVAGGVFAVQFYRAPWWTPTPAA